MEDLQVVCCLPVYSLAHLQAISLPVSLSTIDENTPCTLEKFTAQNLDHFSIVIGAYVQSALLGDVISQLILPPSLTELHKYILY